MQKRIGYDRENEIGRSTYEKKKKTTNKKNKTKNYKMYSHVL